MLLDLHEILNKQKTINYPLFHYAHIIGPTGNHFISWELLTVHRRLEFPQKIIVEP